MKHLPFLLTALMLSSVASAQDPQTPSVTYTVQTATLSNALKAISKLAGKKLYAGDDLANEPIVLRLKAVPLKDTMDKIAEAMEGEWVTYRDGLMLTRTPAVINRLRSEQVASRAAVINKELAALDTARQSYPNLDPEAAGKVAHEYADMMRKEQQHIPSDGEHKRKELSQRTAEARLLQDMIHAIGPERLAELSPDNRNVFAVDPTSAQMAIPNMDASRLQQYAQEHNDLADAIQAASSKGQHDGMLFSGIQQATQQIRNLPCRALLWVTPARNIMDCELTTYDADGNRVADSDWQMGRLDITNYQQEKAKVQAAEAKLPGIKVEPELGILFSRTEDSRATDNLKPIDPHALEYLLHPEIHDPLQLGFAQGILGVAEKEGVDVAATLPDAGFFYALRMCKDAQIKPGLFMLSMTHWGWEDISHKDGWIIGRPLDPLWATQTRIDRNALGRFEQAVYKQGYSSLEDWADLATHVTDEGFREGIIYRTILEAQSWVYDDPDFDASRLYGLLSDEQLASLRSGAPVTFSSLTPAQQNCLLQIALVKGYKLKQSSTTSQDVDNLPLWAEPSETFPDGISGDSLLTMKDDSQEQFFVNTTTVEQDATDSMRGRPMDSNMVAVQMAMAQRQDLFPAGAEAIRSFQFGHKRTITFTLAMTQTIYMEDTLTELQKPSGPPIAVADMKDKLPAEVWDKIDARVQQLLKYYKDNEANFRNRTTSPNSVPPPPPR